MRDKRWKAGLLGLLTAAACVLSGCSSAKPAVAPVEAAGADTGEMVFIGWNTDPYGKGTWYQPGQNVGKQIKDLDLYAQWTKKVTDFAYTGSVQTFTVPADGTYRLEVWGAEGGGDSTYKGGKGGYSYGDTELKKGQKLYIAVGEGGKYVVGAENSTPETFNGGGRGQVLTLQASGDSNGASGSGGGGTSIQSSLYGNGELKNYESVKDTDVLIVAGGGGAGNYCNYANYGSGGYGGGESGGASINMGAPDWSRNGGFSATGGTQTSGDAFGTGASHKGNAVGGGGGWYGGRTSEINGAGGGSGHIGTPMSSGTTVAGNKTFLSPSGVNETGHSGNGYARITLVKVA